MVEEMRVDELESRPEFGGGLEEVALEEAAGFVVNCLVCPVSRRHYTQVFYASVLDWQATGSRGL